MTIKRERPAHLQRLYELKGIWREQVFLDHSLTPSTFRVGYAMADFMTMDDTADEYRRSGKVIIYPSQETLRSNAGVKSIDTVHAGIKQLIEGGHLRRLKRGNQFSGSNTYRVLFAG